MTLVELLVSLTISGVLLTVLGGLLSLALDEWSSQTSRHVNHAEASAVLETVVEDLRSMVIRRDGSEWFQFREEVVEDLGRVPVLSFLARPVDGGSAVGGDVCAMIYRLAKRDPFGSNEPVHALYRTWLSPEATFDHLMTEDWINEVWNTRTSETTDIDHLLAGHVVGLDFEFQVQFADGEVRTLKDVSALRCTDRVEVTPPLADAEDREFFLSGIEIRLTVVDRAAQYALNDGALPLSEIVSRWGYTYTEAVALPSPTL